MPRRARHPLCAARGSPTRRAGRGGRISSRPRPWRGSRPERDFALWPPRGAGTGRCWPLSPLFLRRSSTTGQQRPRAIASARATAQEHDDSGNGGKQRGQQDPGQEQDNDEGDHVARLTHASDIAFAPRATLLVTSAAIGARKPSNRPATPSAHTATGQLRAAQASRTNDYRDAGRSSA